MGCQWYFAFEVKRNFCILQYGKILYSTLFCGKYALARTKNTMYLMGNQRFSISLVSCFLFHLLNA